MELTLENILVSLNENSNPIEVVVKEFFTQDNIDPKKFFANYKIISNGSRKIYQSSAHLTDEPDLSVFGTKTIDSICSPLDWPLGYERWFISAYPDVVVWITHVADETEKPELSFPEITEYSITENGKIDFKTLRLLIDKYKKNNTLECAS